VVSESNPLDPNGDANTGPEEPESESGPRAGVNEDQHNRLSIGSFDQVHFPAGGLAEHALDRQRRQRFSHLRTGEDRLLVPSERLHR